MKNGKLSGAVITLAVGLALNISLGVAKLVVGILASSTSVSSDALNNLSDAAVSVVTVIATVLAARHADHNHPYGYGRYEYIATFVVGAGILAVGIEVLSSGIERAISPVAVDVGTAVIATLGASIAVKAFMAIFYFARAGRTKSDTVKAAGVDSVSDVITTSVVLSCLLAEKYTGAHIDGYASIAVALVILFMAVKILKGTISRLIGERPDPDLYDRLLSIISEPTKVISVHDIVINDYGRDNKIAEADAVFPADMSFVEVHEVCDGIERKAFEETGVRLSLHADPFDGDERMLNVVSRIAAAISAYGATAHDIKIDDEKKTVELDIHMPDDNAEGEIAGQAKAAVRAVIDYEVLIRTDYI